MKYFKQIINTITMYRLVVYILAGYTGLALIFSLLGKLTYTLTEMIVSLIVLSIPAYVVNEALGRLFKTPTNADSALITTLILFLILKPGDDVASYLLLALAGAVSIASKFLISWNGKHIFNPAATGAAVLSVGQLHPVVWWIGNGLFWPVTLIFGLVVAYKIRRMPMVLTFFAVSIVVQAIVLSTHDQLASDTLQSALLSSPLIFLGTIMLTEPATMPPRRNQQLLFAALVGALYITGWSIGPLNISPEIALLIGSIYAFAVSPKFRVRMQLHHIQKISDRVYDYMFIPDRAFNFMPGQYMEWTLAGVPYDTRGNRRTFTIASSPTEDYVHIGLKYHEPSSTYKARFSRLKPGDYIFASQLAGNFTVDTQANDKLLFIAGGIGITPFRSMIKYFVDSDSKCDIVLLYVVSDPDELAYHTDFEAAKKIGLRYVPIVTKPGHNAKGIVNARLSQKTVKELVPDYADRVAYVSGPDRMVDATKHYLRDLGVARRNIKTDHFSGY